MAELFFTKSAAELLILAGYALNVVNMDRSKEWMIDPIKITIFLVCVFLVIASAAFAP